MAKLILLTRPQAQSDAFAGRLKQRFGSQVSVIISPVLEIESFPVTRDITRFQAILFTSTNGVRSFAQSHSAQSPLCVCVGDKTLAEANKHGFTAVSANGNASDLITMVKTTLTPENGPLLYARGEVSSGDVAESLREAGYDVTEQIYYAQHTLSLSAEVQDLLTKDAIDIYPVFSTKTAEALATYLPTKESAGHLICLSENIRKALHNRKFRTVSVAKTPTIDAMESEIEAFLQD